MHDRATVRTWFAGILVALAMIGALNLGIFYPTSAGLDASWGTVLGEAASHGWILGRDIILTGGPLSALYTRYFDSVNWPYAIAAGLLIVGVMAWSCSRLASTWAVALLVPFALCINVSRDAVFMALPTFCALAVLMRPGAPLFFIPLAAVATAAIVLAKFTPIAVAIVSFVAIDIALVRERRLPIATATFIVAMLGGYALLEGSVAYFIDFIRYSVETAAGYSAAMSGPGSRLELAGFLVLAGILGIIVLVRTCQHAVAGSKLKPVLAIFVIGAFGFSGFKAGFVRHDLHSLAAWNVLALAAAAYAGLEERRALRWLVVALSLSATAASLVVLSANSSVTALAQAKHDVSQIGVSLSGLSRLARDPTAWLQQQRADMQQARAAVRAAKPLLPIQGSVDVVPSIQSALIAAGLDYRPRFTIQEYTTYTRALIAKNRESWFGPRAPDHILFAPEPVDNRLPALTEGPLWPDLLRFYEPTQRLPELALLSRRAHPLPNLLGPPIERNAQLGEPIQIGPSPTFLSLDIRYTWLGHLMSVLFKPPRVDLQLT